MIRAVAVLILVWAVCSTASVYGSSSAQHYVQVLGSGGPELDDGRVSSGYLLWNEGKARVLVDTGPGVSVNFGAAGAKLSTLSAILLTHLHVDHSADLPAFVKGSFFTERTQSLPVYGPDGNHLMPSTREFMLALFGPSGAFRYLQDHIDAKTTDEVVFNATNVPLALKNVTRYSLGDGIKASAIAVHHGPVAALAWRVELAGCSVTFSGDTNNQSARLTQLAKDTDVLVIHNAIPQQSGKTAKNLHMTPQQMGEAARDARAGRVIISHRMNRTNGREEQTLAAMREHYQGPVDFANDMQKWPICAD